jgi:uncharacterized RDD family membrane protein YckC
MLFIVGALVSGMIYGISPVPMCLLSPAGYLLFSYYVMSVMLNMVYFTYFHGTTGQTLGKKLLGLRVVRTTGEPMTIGTAFLRWVGYAISGAILYLGFIWVIFDSRKQGWHDKIAGTYVIRTKHESKVLDKLDGIG